MTENEQPKVCPLCAESIKATAKVCPHCRHWQSRWSLLNPYVGMTLFAVIIILVFGCFGALVNKFLGPKAEFANYRNEITVLNSSFSHRISGSESNLYVTVVGTVTNHSNIAWKDVGVEAQFFDKAGTLIDAITVNSDEYRSVVVLPHGEAAFKIERAAAHPINDYATNRLTVRWAKDVNAW